MYRVIVLYEQEPDAASYTQHVEVCRKVPGGEYKRCLPQPSVLFADIS